MNTKWFAQLILSVLVAGFCSGATAALPAQFSECLKMDTAPNTSFTDLKDMAKVAKMTYCQNQVSLIGLLEVKELLKSNVDVAISLAKTNYSLRDLLEMAQAGSYVLYIDSNKLSRLDLISLAKEGVQLVVMAASSGMAQADLVALANAKSFIYNVDAMIARSNLQDLVGLNVQIVIRTSNANISKPDIVAIAQVNNSLVTVLP